MLQWGGCTIHRIAVLGRPVLAQGKPASMGPVQIPHRIVMTSSMSSTRVSWLQWGVDNRTG